MMADLQWQHSDSTHFLVCFSIGYFLYDAADMIVNHRKRSTYELLLHHSLVILCYSVAVLTRQFVAFVALSILNPKYKSCIIFLLSTQRTKETSLLNT